MIVYVTIGNSDDKLSQAEWSRFAEQVSVLLHPTNGLTHSLIGAWYSLPHESWQNACWCVRIDGPGEKPDMVQHCVDVIKEELGVLAERFRQDSIVFAVADVEFLTPREETP